MGFDLTVDPTGAEYGSGNSSDEEETDVDDEIIKTELKWIESDSHGREQKRMKKDSEPIQEHTLEHSPLFSYDEFHNLDQLFSFEDALQFWPL